MKADRDDSTLVAGKLPTRLTAVPLTQVTIEDDFWSPRLQLWQSVTLNDALDKFERNGALANLDRIAQGLKGGHTGTPTFFDGLLYEMMRAASDFLAAHYDPQLDARLDGYIARIAAAQAAGGDGYLHSYIMLMCPEKRWGAYGADQIWSHEEYNAGCLVDAGVHHYRATHKTSLLAVAVRFADYLCDYIGPAPKHNVVPSHPLPEEAMIKLYRLLRDDPAARAGLSFRGDPQRYLDLVRFWIDNRGNHQGRVSLTEYAQDHMPLVEQPEAVGHAVRATLLYAGLAALAGETGVPEYYQASQRLWRDVTERKMFITGGIGPIHEYEGFSFGYYLPNEGYLETCGGVGLAFWAHQMGLTFGDASYADVFERVIYNNVLAGVALNGRRYSYENPLYTHGNIHRWDWHGCPCCPPMLLKLYSGLAESIYAQDGHGVYVQQYIGSRVEVQLSTGAVGIVLKTGYPWDGNVKCTLQLAQPQTWTMHLRIPDWCPEAVVRVNGQVQAPLDVAASYAVLHREWHDGDVVELTLDMPVQRIVAHPYSNSLRDRVAIQRGPILYCLEGVDNPVRSTTLAADPCLEANYDPALLEGVVVITARAAEGTELRAIPYYAWDNRAAQDAGRDWMIVWLGQDGIYEARLPFDGGALRAWAHRLYQPLED